MKKLLNKCCAVLLAALLLAAVAAPAVQAAQGGDVIAISSEADWLAFAKNCSLDIWSRGKTVTLACDLKLSGGYTAVPSFGGVFDGGGHTVSGVRLTASGSVQGLFRYVQSGAVVKSLNVSGTICPGGSGNTVGGIAGSNAGTIQSCTFTGRVTGNAAVGGIAGVNEEGGQIAACTVSGAVLGTDCTGGVAGRNLGTLLKCSSRCSVNTVAADETVRLDELDLTAPLDQLTDLTGDTDATADTPLNNRTDVGGIAGYSSGIVQSCTNDGDVGYPHLGYNVGGIVGRQTGYLAGCINNGAVCGRKDVGGIAGQSEPYIVLSADSDTLHQLRTELDRLNTLTNQALDDLDNSSDTLSARLTAIGSCTDEARDSSKRLLDQTADFVDANVDTLNDLSISVTNALDKISPATDDIADAGDAFTTLCDRLEDALDTLGTAADTSKAALADAKSAVEQLRSANSAAAGAISDLKAALADLQKAVVVDDQAAVTGALTELTTALSALGGAMSDAGGAFSDLRAAMDGGDWGNIGNNAAALDALSALADSMTAMGLAMGQASTALQTIQNNTHVDWTAVESALNKLSSAMDELQSASTHLNSALSDLSSALGEGETLAGQLGTAATELKRVSDSAATVGRLLSSAFDGISDAVEQLRTDGPVEFTTLGEDYRAAGEDLYAAIGSLSDEMTALNGEVSASEKTLSADLRAVSNQFQVIFDLLIDAVEEVQNGAQDFDLSDFIEDTSDEDIAATKLGKVADCRNAGSVEGDRNVGGVVGAMSVEYDLDPEDDTVQLTHTGTYETKAVVQNCLNRGTVTGKKDCVGGVAGRMDLGTVLGCENYGGVSSTDGSDVGGIAGLSTGTVRTSYAKCTLSGKDYVGGIAGSASALRDCCAIVTVSEGSEWLGAVAGDGDVTSGKILRNYFVDTGVAGIDGVSYSGCAESADFAWLQTIPGIPAEFVSFTLTLRSDGETVKTLPFRYGDDLSLLTLPETPKKDGYYGQWPEFDVSGVSSDITLDAVYTPWVTVVASERTEGKRSLALAEGVFTQQTALTVTDSAVAPPVTAKTGETVDVWEITLTDGDVGEGDGVPLRLLCSGKQGTVWQYVDSGWQTCSVEQRGQYLLVTMPGSSGIFCVESSSGVQLAAVLVFVLLATAILTALALCARKLRRRISKRLKPTKAAK